MQTIIASIDQPSSTTRAFFCGETEPLIRRPLRLYCPTTCGCPHVLEPGLFCPLSQKGPVAARQKISSCSNGVDTLLVHNISLFRGPDCAHLQNMTDAVNGLYACFATDHPNNDWIEDGRWEWAQTYKRVDTAFAPTIQYYARRSTQANLVGDLVGHGFQHKWVLGFERGGIWYSLFYALAPANHTTVLAAQVLVPTDGWIPVNSSNTEGAPDCVAGSLSWSTVGGLHYLAKRQTDTCSETCAEINRSCSDDLQLSHAPQIQAPEHFAAAAARSGNFWDVPTMAPCYGHDNFAPHINSNNGSITGSNSRCQITLPVGLRQFSSWLRCETNGRSGRRRNFWRVCYCHVSNDSSNF